MPTDAPPNFRTGVKLVLSINVVSADPEPKFIVVAPVRFPNVLAPVAELFIETVPAPDPPIVKALVAVVFPIVIDPVCAPVLPILKVPVVIAVPIETDPPVWVVAIDTTFAADPVAKLTVFMPVPPVPRFTI